jgi:hypothetical protein
MYDAITAKTYSKTYSKTMNPDTYLHNDLWNIWYNETVKEGDKITIYQFDSEAEVRLHKFVYQMSSDYGLDVNEVLLRYVPDIDHIKTVYTFIKTNKHHGNKWVVLRTEDCKEIDINLYEVHNCFYSINS